MVLSYINFENFRNYKKEHIQFYPGTNILYGKNGQGKTNILEALYYLALTKSFRTSSDQNLILNDENFFRIQGDFKSGQGKKSVSTISYSLTDGKTLSCNRQRVQKFADYIGTIPLVLLAPSDLDFTQGGPFKRRQFLDIMLSQSSKLYLHHLIQYRRSLKQRNILLQQDHHNRAEIEAWEEALVKNGTIIISKRSEAIERLDQLVQNFYTQLSGNGDKIKIRYQNSFQIKNQNPIEESFRDALHQQWHYDSEHQTTTIGPHRDDLLFLINGQLLRWKGSQGEQKSFIISLRMAEYHYLQNIQNESPLLLFDDIFGELDADRITNMIQSVTKIGQVFVTTTSPHFFNKVAKWHSETSFYHIQQGSVTVREAV